MTDKDTDKDTTDKLIGRSFRGDSLEGADFSGKDLRGADFSGADLRSADFRDARFGVSPRVGAVFFGAAMLAAIAAGVAIGWAVNELRSRISSDQWDEASEGGSIGLIMLVLVGLIIWRGFDFAIKAAVVLYVVVLGLNIVANLIWDEFEWRSVLRGTAILVFMVLAIMAGMLGRVVGGVFGTWSVMIVAVLGGLATGRAEGGLAGIVVAMSLAFISKRSLSGDPRDRLLRVTAHRLVGHRGTQFVDADLSGADFTGVDASLCNVNGAAVDDVTWDPDKPMPLDLEGVTTSDN